MGRVGGEIKSFEGTGSGVIRWLRTCGRPRPGSIEPAQADSANEERRGEVRGELRREEKGEASKRRKLREKARRVAVEAACGDRR